MKPEHDLLEKYKSNKYREVISSISNINKGQRKFQDHYLYIKSLNRSHKLEEALAYAKSLLDDQVISDDISNLKIIYEIIWSLYKKGDMGEAKEYLNKAKKILDKMDYDNLNKKAKKAYHSIINLAGITYYSLGDIDKAETYFKRILKYSENIKDNTVIQGGKINLGLIYLDKGLYKEAISYFSEGLELAEETTHLEHIRVASTNLSNLNKLMGNLKIAEKFANKAVKISDQQNDDWGKGITKHILGDIYRKKGEHHKAIKYLDQSYELLEPYDNIEKISRVLFDKILIYIDLEKRGNARDLLRKLKSYNEEIENKRVDIIYSISEAVYLSKSPIYRHKVKAEDKLRQIIQDIYGIESGLISIAYLTLISLLLAQIIDLDTDLSELNETKNELLMEIETLSDYIGNIAKNNDIPELELQANYINAYKAIFQKDYSEALNLIDKADKISKRSGLENVIIPNPSRKISSIQPNEISLQFMDNYLNNVIHTLPRLKIMVILSSNTKLQFSELKELSGLTSGNLSNHCKTLIEAGYLHKSKELINDRFLSVYSLTPKGIKEFNQYKSVIKPFL